MDDYVYTISNSISYLPEVDEEIFGLEPQPDLEDDRKPEEVTGLIESFMEAYDIYCEGDEEKIIGILEKKNSERSDKEKQIIRKIVKSNKREIPKIEVERQQDTLEYDYNLDDWGVNNLELGCQYNLQNTFSIQE